MGFMSYYVLYIQECCLLLKLSHTRVLLRVSFDTRVFVWHPYLSIFLSSPVLSLDITTLFSLLFSRQLCRSHGGDSRERNREQVGLGQPLPAALAFDGGDGITPSLPVAGRIWWRRKVMMMSIR
ncbi:hypothetical protein Hanom_Chr02g00112721 [Helianthus anomalus]